jgi:hypothetical protein
MKKLKNYGVHEIETEKIRETNGGFFGVDDGIALAVAGALIYLYNEGDDFVDGFNSSYQRARYGSGGASGSW